MFQMTIYVQDCTRLYDDVVQDYMQRTKIMIREMIFLLMK